MDKYPKLPNQSLQEALGAYERENPARFHMPGHKGRGLSGFWRDELQLWDVTELSNTDNLHAPSGAIAAAEAGMAQAYGAKASFFVVNGGTNAVQAMILAGMGCSVIPEFMPLMPGISTRLIVEPEVTRTISLVTVSGRRFSPSVQALISLMQKQKWTGDM